ncbi:FBP domain-containing protein [Actinomadura roseirufa]|uniref:FBP domain-containing protein n=1 Tax=Actinomadura roseirufa TaxID=2094049 RepID=UPI00104138ED|nr:FBP domain-containing protein [Actinomadura roseirufa]
MRPVTERDVRASFVNVTRGQAQRLAMPRDLDARPWPDLDFLGWRDPAAPQRAYLVTETGDELTGVALRLGAPRPGHMRRSMCSLCLTTHTGDGVTLLSARRAGRDGHHGNSVGAYLCTDLACSLYLRGKKHAGPGGRLQETLTLDELITRTTANLTAFLAKVTG